MDRPDKTVDQRVAEVAASVGNRKAGVPWAVFAVFAACVIVIGVGLVRQGMAATESRVAQCERVNALRAELARILISAQAAITAEEYTAAVKEFYDHVLDNLQLVNCDEPPIVHSEVEFPVIPNRQVNEPPPPDVPPLNGVPHP